MVLQSISTRFKITLYDIWVLPERWEITSEAPTRVLLLAQASKKTPGFCFAPFCLTALTRSGELQLATLPSGSFQLFRTSWRGVKLSRATWESWWRQDLKLLMEQNRKQNGATTKAGARGWWFLQTYHTSLHLSLSPFVQAYPSARALTFQKD